MLGENAHRIIPHFGVVETTFNVLVAKGKPMNALRFFSDQILKRVSDADILQALRAVWSRRSVGLGCIFMVVWRMIGNEAIIWLPQLYNWMVGGGGGQSWVALSLSEKGMFRIVGIIEGRGGTNAR